MQPSSSGKRTLWSANSSFPAPPKTRRIVSCGLVEMMIEVSATSATSRAASSFATCRRWRRSVIFGSSKPPSAWRSPCGSMKPID
jgi:hypothetical protein